MSGRVRVRGWLRVESPLHVGGLDGGPADALPIAVDGQGRLYVPGTSLAGVLRQWFRDVENPDGVDDLWGFVAEQPERRSSGTDAGEPATGGAHPELGRASRVIVADGLITTEPRLDADDRPAAPLDPGRLEFRPSAGIDRVTGAAAQEFLYGRAVVPAGSCIRFEIDIESRDGDLAQTAARRGGPQRVEPDTGTREPGYDAAAGTPAGGPGAGPAVAVDEVRMGALLAALADREIRLGAATGRGLGVVRLLDDPLTIVVDRFDSPEGLLAVLRDDPARTRTLASLRTAAAVLPPRRERLHVRVAWRPRAPVMVRSGTAGLIVDTLPLTTRLDREHLTLVLPGSTIKGALRAHAELIERTARGPAVDLEPPEPDASAADHSAAFRRWLDQLPAVRALFGSARDHTVERRAGALRAEECNALVTIPESLWRSVTGSDPGQDEVPEGDGVPATAGTGAVTGGSTTMRETPAGVALPARGSSGTGMVAGSGGSDGARHRLSDHVRDRLADIGMEQADHVALDRWTGGAADGRLFSVLEPYQVEWEPIRLSVDLPRLGRERGPALALLLLSLRDLAAGRLPLGAAVNRGFGDIEVTEITLTGGDWPDPVELHDALTGPASPALDQAWADYLAQEVR